MYVCMYVCMLEICGSLDKSSRFRRCDSSFFYFMNFFRLNHFLGFFYIQANKEVHKMTERINMYQEDGDSLKSNVSGFIFDHMKVEIILSSKEERNKEKYGWGEDFGMSCSINDIDNNVMSR